MSHPDPAARMLEILAEMRSEKSRYKSHPLGFVDSVSASSVDEWADELTDLAGRLAPAPPHDSKPSPISIQRFSVNVAGQEWPCYRASDVEQLVALLLKREPCMAERCATCGKTYGDHQDIYCDSYGDASRTFYPKAEEIAQ